MFAKACTLEGDQLDVLVTLVEAYERAHSSSCSVVTNATAVTR